MTDRWRVGANLATLGNAALGVGAVAYTLAGNKLWGMLLVVMAIGLDGLDGMLSRRSTSRSAGFGRLADSVADGMSFGVSPAVFLAVHTTNTGLWTPLASWTTVVAAVYLAAAVARLVYFTVRAHALPHFLGVPTPECTLALVVALLFLDSPGFFGVEPVALSVIGVVLAISMILPVPYPKIRQGSPLRLPMALTAGFAALALVPLQFRPAAGSWLFTTSSIAAWGLLVGVAAYFLVGPLTLSRADPSQG